MSEMMLKGHSRVPVYSGQPANIIGLVLVSKQTTKNCVQINKIRRQSRKGGLEREEIGKKRESAGFFGVGKVGPR